jgi:hypothetical protein
MDKQWNSYNVGVSDYTLPQSSKAAAPYQTSSSEHGMTGFQDLTPANPQLQARYDAMSPQWEGLTGASNNVFKNMNKSESAVIQK